AATMRYILVSITISPTGTSLAVSTSMNVIEDLVRPSFVKLFLIVCLSVLAMQVRAQAPAGADDSFALGTIEIIGQRMASDSAVTTDTVLATELAARHRDDLSQALDLVPGVAIENTGQRRERTISLR